MKVLHLNAGNDTGGGMHHILLLLSELPRHEVILGVFENGELVKRANELGIQTIIFKQESRKDFSIVNKVVNFIDEQKIDIIHTHGARANLFGTLIKKKAKCKWFVTVHSNPDDDFLGKGIKGKVFSFLNKWSIKKADHLFAISERFKRMVENYGISTEKITTIVNGIDFSMAPTYKLTRSDFNIADDDFLIIMVARLDKVKDHLTALNAIKKVVPTNRELRLLIVGEGAERKAIEDRVKEFNLTSNVQLVGHREDVTEIFPLTDICLLTSKSESFPLVLLESARASVPVITTDVGGVDLMIPSEQFGWIKEIGDTQEISDAIKEAIKKKSEGEITQIGSKFHLHCKENFSISRQANDIYMTYQRLK